MKFLFIDNSQDFLDKVKRFFLDRGNVFVAECHSVKEAFDAISLHKPDVILMDHRLSPNRNEGLEIIDEIRANEMNIKIISTTSTYDALAEYEKRGIEIISKWDFKKFKLIIDEQDGKEGKETTACCFR